MCATADEEFLHVLEVEHAFVVCLAEDHGKHAYVIQVFDVVHAADAPAGQYADLGKALDDRFIKIECGALQHAIARYVGCLDVFQPTRVGVLEMIEQRDLRFAPPSPVEQLFGIDIGDIRAECNLLTTIGDHPGGEELGIKNRYAGGGDVGGTRFKGLPDVAVGHDSAGEVDLEIGVGLDGLDNVIVHR